MVSGTENSCSTITGASRTVVVARASWAGDILVSGVPGAVSTLGIIVGLATPRGIGIGGIPVTCLLLVLHLVLVMVPKRLVYML